MRSSRLLAALLLLQAHRRLTARALAERLEVSERTVHRDMEALSAAGIPVYAERGPGGGWVLSPEYRARPPGLNGAEVRALFLGGPNQVLADLGLDDAARGALLKLLAAVPAEYRFGAEEMRQRVYVDTAGWHRSREEAPCLPAVQDALWGGYVLRLVYGRSDGGEVALEVHPYGLVAKGTAWYLVGATAGGEPRTYRVSRIRQAESLDEPAVRPDGFKLADYWERQKVQFTAALPRYTVLLRARAEALPRLRQAGFWSRVEREEPPDETGWALVEMRFELEEDARACLLGFSAAVEVLRPEALRDQVRAGARAVLALYGES